MLVVTERLFIIRVNVFTLFCLVYPFFYFVPRRHSAISHLPYRISVMHGKLSAKFTIQMEECCIRAFVLKCDISYVDRSYVDRSYVVC